MAEFLSFTDRQLLNAGGTQILTHRTVDFRRIDQIIFRHMSVAIIFHHAGVYHRRTAAAIKMREVILFKRRSDLQCTVTTEVIVDNRIAVIDGAYRSLAIIRDDKRRQILVNRTCTFTQFYHCIMSIGKIFAVAVNMSFPAQTHHIPVGIVTVHGYNHAPATGGNPVINPIGI